MEITYDTHSIQRKQRSDKVGKARDINRRNKPFIAWDGEGFNHNGKHYYGLFGNSLGQVIKGYLSWRDCVNLLFAAPKEAHHVIFAGTYDVVMMFRDLPQISQLLKGDTVYVERYRIQFLRSKYLRITDRENKDTRTLYDVFTFFACSFVKACRQYLGDTPMIAEIEAMKAQRNNFTLEMMKGNDISQYMSQELSMLVLLCDQLRDMLAKVDIHPSAWHGPGAVASTVMKMHGIKLHKGNHSKTFRRLAEGAYYGGRFEPFKRGRAHQEVYQYDIRSAYPNAMRLLPSLNNCTYHYTPVVNSVHDFGLYHVKYLPTQRNYREAGWLPHRMSNGNIYYPDWANGWYWGIEIPDHMKASIVEGWEPQWEGEITYPFRFVQSMYVERNRLKEANQPHQLALKLALNSLYGKLAQSKGAKQIEGEWRFPTYHEIVWAGWITAFTRKMIADALHSVPYDSIIATETDSVFSLQPLKLSVGSDLGQWEATELEDVIYLQSGVSLVKKGDDWSFKTRGFTLKKHENILTVWQDHLSVMPVPDLEVEQTRFGTDPRMKTFGEWYTTTHNLRLDGNPLEKRVHLTCEDCLAGNTYADSLHPLMVPPIPYAETTPYAFIWNAEHQPYTQLDTSVNDPILDLEFKEVC